LEVIACNRFYFLQDSGGFENKGEITMRLKKIGLVLGATIVVLVGIWLMVRQVTLADGELPILGQVPNFEFIERSGNPFGLEDLKTAINVVDFIFTSCPGVCPEMSSKMAKLYEAFKGNNRIRFVSISVDPENDTLEVLKQYAMDNGVNDERWLFLRAPIEQVVELSVKGFRLPAENLPAGHSTKFILVDNKGRIRGYYEGLSDESMEEIKRDIGRLEK